MSHWEGALSLSLACLQATISLYRLMRVVRVLCCGRNKTSNDMFLFLFAFVFPGFVLLCYLVRGGLNEEGEGADSAILRKTDSWGDNTQRENQFTYRLYRMTKENRAINTHAII